MYSVCLHISWMCGGIYVLLCLNNEHPPAKQKWVTFTYFGKQTLVITWLFKNLNIWTSFRTTNVIRNHLKPKRPIIDIFSKSAICQLTCTAHLLKYVGQAGWTFNTQFRQHEQVIRTNKPNSKYYQHTEWPKSQLT
jgi:hypothetical protein